jgi:hypothetical protein
MHLHIHSASFEFLDVQVITAEKLLKLFHQKEIQATSAG